MSFLVVVSKISVRVSKVSRRREHPADPIDRGQRSGNESISDGSRFLLSDLFTEPSGLQGLQSSAVEESELPQDFHGATPVSVVDHHRALGISEINQDDTHGGRKFSLNRNVRDSLWGFERYGSYRLHCGAAGSGLASG